MSYTGIAVSEDAVATFNRLKLGRDLRYIVLRISDSPGTFSVVVETTGGPGASWGDFLRALPEDQPRWGVFKLQARKKRAWFKRKARQLTLASSGHARLGRNCALPYYFLKEVALSLPIKLSREKIAFILWSPEKSKVRAKMLVTSSTAIVKQSLIGIGTQGEATDYSELDYACFLQHAFSPSDDIL